MYDGFYSFEKWLKEWDDYLIRWGKNIFFFSLYVLFVIGVVKFGLYLVSKG